MRFSILKYQVVTSRKKTKAAIAIITIITISAKLKLSILEFCLGFITFRAARALLLTSGGFTSVAAFEAEYARLDRTKLWKKRLYFTREAAIA
ncbi:hypothetical protein HYN48_13990 [Flavobacterium magnum]|uniref:Uncharacterized protein n=1 Tax=Flavobacterium magnum TaxID=2162713 RepID=A0A2S0RIL2_9FLAO|nr:hypothetical protein HYN48_13990 [Flavobacterium magnum]